MIISASRRTDIPAFYSEWFMRRVRRGECLVPNPRNPAQASTVSLRPADVDAVVFWTRNARPLLPHLDELDAAGYRYYFLYTLLDYPRQLDPGCPAGAEAVDTFRRLSDRIGPDRAVWRYDPVVVTDLTGPDFHRRNFERIAGALDGYTRRCVVSVVDPCRKAARRMEEAAGPGGAASAADPRVGEVLRTAACAAAAHSMQVQTCAEPGAGPSTGIPAGKCVDDGLLERVFGVRTCRGKDPSQRPACRCVVSRDIGMYDTCVYGCRYCYATGDPAKAAANLRRHDPDAPSLLPP